MDIVRRLQSARIRADLWRRVRRHGWTAAYIVGDREPRACSYTIGFDETLDHPELIIFDVPGDAANEVFWQVFKQIRDGQLVLTDGLDWSDDPDLGLAWRKVHPDWINEWLPWARLRRFKVTGKPYGLEAYQLVLCDPEGRLPWEPGYDERLRPRQPSLWEPPVA